MAKRKPCDRGCGRPKRPGHPKWCEECWLREQKIGVREAARVARLKLVPESLRKKVCPERLWPPGRRWCGGCQTFVLTEDCSGSRCRTCASVASHSSKLVSEYGVTREVYDAMYALQDGRCALCNREFGKRRPAGDHDHRTGEFRGLLCNDNEWGCNVKVVGRFDADPNPVAMAYRLVDYLTNPPARRLQVRP